MTAKLDKEEEEEKSKDLDSLSFPKTKTLLERITKSLGFKALLQTILLQAYVASRN